jgi:hypothetical protein
MADSRIERRAGQAGGCKRANKMTSARVCAKILASPINALSLYIAV